MIIRYFNKKGEMHKLDGPAEPGHQIFRPYWYVEGVEVSFPYEFVECIRNIAEHGKAHDEAIDIPNRYKTVEEYSRMLIVLRNNGHLKANAVVDYINEYVDEYLDALNYELKYIVNRNASASNEAKKELDDFYNWWKKNKARLTGQQSITESKHRFDMSKTIGRYNEHNELHSLSKPAFEGLGISFDRMSRNRLNRGTRTRPRISTFSYYHIWFEEGHYHRDDGPCVIVYDGNGIKTNEYWYEYNACHRSDGPAAITYGYGDGDIEYGWYWNGMWCGRTDTDDLETAPAMWRGPREKYLLKMRQD